MTIAELSSGPLAQLERAHIMLAEASTLDDVKGLRDQAQTLAAYSKAAKLGLTMQNECAELKLRAERKAGEMLRAMPKRSGARDGKTGLHDVTPLLADVGVSKIQSMRWQQVAAVPEPEFERHLAEAKESKAELTTASVFALQNKAKRDRTRQAEAAARTIKIDTVQADATGPGWRMLSGDFRERMAEIPDGTIDAIMTDPPYPAEFLPLWSDLAKHAARVLKPQGLLIALSGKIQLADVMVRLGEHLNYGWIYAQPVPGSNTRILARHAVQEWKPWLAYSNGTWPSGNIDWHGDITDPSKMSKSYRWEQGSDPAAYLIDKLTSADQTIIDPFSGTGTYGATAVSMGRQFIGFEQDSARFDLSVAKMQDVADGI